MEKIRLEAQKILERYATSPLSDALLQQLLDQGRPASYPRGGRIIAAGDAESKLYILLSGLVRKFFLDEEGRETTHLFLEPRSIFTTDYVMLHQPSLCHFEAVEETQAMVFAYPAIQEAMRREPALLQVYTGILEQALRARLLRENALITQSATQRYQTLLAQIPGIDQRVPHAHIASYIGVTPASLSRIRRGLRGG